MYIVRLHEFVYRKRFCYNVYTDVDIPLLYLGVLTIVGKVELFETVRNLI